MQPSLFSADMMEPDVGDLGGVLAAHGQVTASAAGARLSILLSERWRADVLAEACMARGVEAGVMRPEDSADWLVRTDRSPALVSLARAWTRGAVKAEPTGLVVTAGMLRMWVVAAGRDGPAGYELGLDPHAVDTHRPLAAALAEAGLAGVIVGSASADPVVRVTGRRRLNRLVEMVGSRPPHAPISTWPGADGLA